MDISNNKLPWWNILLAIVFIGVIAFVSVKYAPLINDVVRNTDKFRELILSYGEKGALVFIGFQIAHIFIPIIPGEVVQIAGGYIYGTFAASIYMITGTLIGTIFVFYASRYIGYPIVQIFVKPATIEKFKAILSSRKAEIIIFVMMLIPGFPKDTVVYIAGLTPIQAVRFIIISVTARTPGLIGSAYIGSNLHQKDYTTVIIMLIIAAIAVAIAYYLRNSKYIKDFQQRLKLKEND
jgi:uncharacterized membrane protein YdjX (TVP38/TMEM64 family)